MSPAPAPDDTDAARKREILMKEPGEFSLTVTTLAFPDTKHPERRDPVEALVRGLGGAWQRRAGAYIFRPHGHATFASVRAGVDAVPWLLYGALPWSPAVDAFATPNDRAVARTVLLSRRRGAIRVPHDVVLRVILPFSLGFGEKGCVRFVSAGARYNCLI